MKKRLTIFLLAAATCFGAAAQTVLLQEDFSSSTLPSGWTNDSLGQPATYTWQFNNPGSRLIQGAGFDTSFVIFDSDHYGSQASEYASLTTAPVSASGFTALWLELDEQYFTQQAPGSLRKIEATGDGVNWFVVDSDSVSVGYPVAVHNVFRLDTLAGASSVVVRFTFAGTWDYWWAIDNVRLLATAACTSPPEAGQAVSSHTEVCSTTVFSLSLSGDSSGTGLSYQWQQSADNIAWNDMTGDTAKNISATQSDSAWYRCIVSCSGQPDTSDAVFVGMHPADLCYCLPVTPACSGQNYITEVSISGTGFDNISACTDHPSGIAYSSWPASGTSTAVLHRHVTYDFSVRSFGTNSLSMWIDYDHSGTFDSLEFTRIDLLTSQGSPSVVSVQIPDTAMMGLTGMRIRCRAVGNQNGANDACTSFASGETEDYYINIDTLINGIHDPVFAGLSLYPNPVTSILYLDFGGMLHDKVTVTIYDAFGRELSRYLVSGIKQMNMPFENLAPGLYFITIDDGRNRTTRKVLHSNN